MPLLLLNAFGWVYAHWRLAASVAAFLAILVLGVALFRSCGRSTPKLDQEEIVKSQKAIAADDRKTMIEILANSSVREQGIDSNIKQAEEAANKAKRDYSEKSNEELAAELDRRAKE